MKTIQKLFLLTVLGMGVYVSEIKSDAIQAEIRTTVHNHRHEIDNIRNSNQLNHFLATLKNEILKILNNAGELSDRNKALKEALESLNPSDKMSIATNIKNILANLETDIANTIKNAIPQIYRTILGL